MLIIGFNEIGVDSFVNKYRNNVIKLNYARENTTNDYLIEFIESIKEQQLNYDVVVIPYVNEVVLCLDTLAIPFTVIYPTEMDKTRIEKYKAEYNVFKALAMKHDSIVLKPGEDVEHCLKDKFEWVVITENVKNEEENQEVKEKENQEVKEENQEKSLEVKEEENIKPAVNKKKLTLQELVENDLEITEADVRELKTETNRFKVAMLLQAKSRLSMVLKLCDTLDKLYAELVVRINQSLTTTDTSSLMFTADYISKALADTNQFIMSLITNEKIQNFFIIDNSNVINITENRVDIDKREKIRKAAEIVIENVDYFSNGEYDKMVNPNAIEVEPTLQEKEGEENANSTTKSVSS